MTQWTDFVKSHYGKVKHLPNKERLKALSAMYKGKPHSKKGVKGVKGGNILDVLGNLF